jgi:hypothetical protein
MSDDTTSWRLVILGALIGISGPYGYEVIRLNIFDAKQYYTYQSTEGPFEGIMTNGELVAGHPKSTLNPGEWIAWRTTICFAAGVAVTADITLRALPNGKPMQMRHTKITADARCGPQVRGLQVPVDVPSGDYAIERRLLIEPDNAPAVSVRVPSIEFHVAR